MEGWGGRLLVLRLDNSLLALSLRAAGVFDTDALVHPSSLEWRLALLVLRR